MSKRQSIVREFILLFRFRGTESLLRIHKSRVKFTTLKFHILSETHYVQNAASFHERLEAAYRKIHRN